MSLALYQISWLEKCRIVGSYEEAFLVVWQQKLDGEGSPDLAEDLIEDSLETTTEEKIAQIEERIAELSANGYTSLSSDEMEELGGLDIELEILLHSIGKLFI